MNNKVAGYTIIRSQKALDRWEKKNSITYCAKPTEFPCLVQDLNAADENGKTDVLYLHELVAMAKALVHEQDMAALKATKPELFKQIKNIIFKGADPDCKQCKGTGRYRLPPAFPRTSEAWGDCPCVTTVAKHVKGNVETTIIDQGFAVCIEDRAIYILKTKGEMRASDLGWELWGDTCQSNKRGTGSHRSNKFCRPAGKLLKRLQADERVTHFAKPGGIFWRAI